MFYFKIKIGWDFYDLNKVNKKKKKNLDDLLLVMCMVYVF